MVSSPSWLSRKTSVGIAQTSRFSARYSTIFSAALPSSSSLTWPLFGGGGDDDRTVVPEPRVADEAGLDPDVGERDGLLRLRLRAHDPLERRVPRLVDRVRHGDDGGQRRGDHVVPELGLALARELRSVDRQLGDLGDQRPAEPVGHGRPEHGAVRVAGLLAEEDEVRLLPLERGRERSARGEQVRAGRGVVGDEQCTVGAHRERLAQRLHRLLGAERDDDDLASVRVLQPERLLDGVHVRRVEHAFA